MSDILKEFTFALAISDDTHHVFCVTVSPKREEAEQTLAEEGDKRIAAEGLDPAKYTNRRCFTLVPDFPNGVTAWFQECGMSTADAVGMTRALGLKTMEALQSVLLERQVAREAEKVGEDFDPDRMIIV